MPPLNMPLWYIDYLELQTLEKQKKQSERLSVDSRVCLKTQPPKRINLSSPRGEGKGPEVHTTQGRTLS